VLAFFSAGAYRGLIGNIERTRISKYNYESQQEKFYQFGEFAQKNGANTKDIFVLDASEDDYWFRYYILFLTGAEARTLNEIVPMEISLEQLKTKYDHVHFVFNQSRYIPDVVQACRNTNFPNFTVVSFDLNGSGFDKLKEDISTQVIQEVSNSNNVFDLYEVKNNFQFIKVINPQIYRLLSEKYEKLLSNYTAESEINENVSFVDYYYKKVSPNKYKFYFLFKVKRSFDKNWLIYLHGYVKEEHLSLLSEEGQRYKFENWWIIPESSMFTWPAGEYIIVTSELEAKPIAYNMKMGFYRPDAEPTRQIELGWVDLAAADQLLRTDQFMNHVTHSESFK
jgi:hypothetical protein